MNNLSGISLFQVCVHGIHVGHGLSGSHSRFQVSHRLEKPMFRRTRVQVRRAHLLLVHDRHKEIRSKEHDRSLELRRRHADDGERVLIELNDAADSAWIVVEPGVPICMGEHNIRSAVGAVLVGCVKQTAKVGVNAQHVEVISRRCEAVCGNRIFASIESHSQDHVESGQILEAVVAIAQIDVVGIRLPRGIVPVVSSVEALHLRHIQWPQDQAIHDAEHNGVCPDGQRQRQNSSDGETGRFAQLAQRKADIGRDRLQRAPLPHFAALFLHDCSITEGKARCSFCFLQAHAIAHQLLGTLFHVQADFFREIVVNLAAAEDLRNPVHWNLLSDGPFSLWWPCPG
jgi:hypothetical protein